MAIEKTIGMAGKWISGKWVKTATEVASSTASRGRWVNGKWVKEATQALEDGKVYTKMKTAIKAEAKGVTDTFSSKFTLPTARAEIANVEHFLTELRSSTYARPINIPSDIPLNIDFSGATKKLVGSAIPIRDETGAIVREYFTRNGKDLSLVKIYDIATGNPKTIINYQTKYGKRIVCGAKELNPVTGHEIKRCSYWDDTGILRGVSSKNEAGKEVVVAFKENGTDIEYVTNAGIAIYKP